MFPAWILLTLNHLFFTLRLSGGTASSFPRPLKAEEERQYLELAAQGDLEARNKLIEHNLRLVAHIMKKYYTPQWRPGRPDFHWDHWTDQGDQYLPSG